MHRRQSVFFSIQKHDGRATVAWNGLALMLCNFEAFGKSKHQACRMRRQYLATVTTVSYLSKNGFRFTELPENIFGISGRADNAGGRAWVVFQDDQGPVINNSMDR